MFAASGFQFSFHCLKTFESDCLSYFCCYHPYISVNASSLTIWIDPLDATKEYIEGLTQYTTVMIGIAVDGTPVAGIIHKPFLVETVVGVNLPGFR